MTQYEKDKAADAGRFADLLRRVEAAKKERPLDLSVAEDLSVALMNLVSLEEHFFFTAMKTGESSYHGLSADVRALRKEFMEKLLPPAVFEGETWCAVKHLLAAAMRLIEVGGKYKKEGDEEGAARAFSGAYRLYAIFWALKLKLAHAKPLVKAAHSAAQDEAMTLEELVNRLADCCKE